jgi:tRNA 2-thiouridine synthesizing protein A
VVDKVKHAPYRLGMEFDRDIDAEGLLCPLPVLRAAKVLRAMGSGEVLRLRATDPAAVVDVPHFCRESGAAFLGTEDHGAATHYFIRKA